MPSLKIHVVKIIVIHWNTVFFHMQHIFYEMYFNTSTNDWVSNWTLSYDVDFWLGMTPMTSGSQNAVKLWDRPTGTRFMNCFRITLKFLMLRALCFCLGPLVFTWCLSGIKIHSKYRLSLQLYKLYISKVTNDEWTDLNFQQNFIQ